MIHFKWKNLFAAACVAGLTTGIGACSKSPPPSQPPVVNNVNSGAATTSTANQAKSTPVQQAQNPAPTQQASVTPSVSTSTSTYQQCQFVQEPSPSAALQTSNLQSAKLDEASFLNMQIHEIALQLLKNFRDGAGPNGPVAVATFVDLNNLYRTSPFGRYIAEQLMGELQRAGFNVVEIRKTDSIMVKPRYGEYGLSRDIQELARQSSARYILAGTYVTKGRYILINARLISNENNLVASSGLKILRKDPFLERMLWPSASPETVPAVRVPVKELGSLSEMKILSGS